MKLIRRTLTLLLVIALLATTALLFTSCSDKKESGITYELSTDKSYYIVTGIGNYAGTALSIPKTYDGKPVKEIAKNAFKDCTDLTSVTLPDGLEVIGAGAFSGCTGLTSIKIPDTVVSMGSGVFKGCKDLEVTVPFAKAPDGWSDDWDTGIDEIIWESKTEDDETEKSSESDTSSKPAVAYSKGLKFIKCDLAVGDDMIECYSVQSMGTCTDTVISIPPTHEGIAVAHISPEAFLNRTSITEVIIPESVIFISMGAFAGCSSLESITLPTVNYEFTMTGGAKYYEPFGYIFGDQEFDGSEATYQSRRNKNTGYHEGVTYYVPTSLKNITVTKAVLGDRGMFSGCSNLVSVTLPENTTYISRDMFKNCRSLTTVNIPKSVGGVDMDGFSGCSSLTSIALPEGATSIASGALEGCTALESITLPSTMKTIGDCAFKDCQKLGEVILPTQLETIGDQAFAGCASLTSIIIPARVNSMGEEVFDDDCSSLTTIYVCASSIPSRWNTYWNMSDAYVREGYTG